MGGFADVLNGQDTQAPAPIEARSVAPVVGASPAAPPMPAATGPKPEDVNSWKAFFSRLRDDPSLQQRMFQIGTTMMQGQSTGESGIGMLGRALQGGNMAAQFTKANQLAAAQKQQQVELEAQRNAAQTDLVKANVETQGVTRAGMKQEQAQQAEAFPVAMEKSKFELESLPKKLKADLISAASRSNQDNAMADYYRKGGSAGQNITYAEAILQSAAEQTPRNDGESDVAWRARVGRVATDLLKKGTPGTAIPKPGADLKTLIESQANLMPGTPTHTRLQGLIDKQLGEMEGGGGAAAAPNSWEAARNSVKPGETYTGPDGKKYKRNN